MSLYFVCLANSLFLKCFIWRQIVFLFGYYFSFLFSEGNTVIWQKHIAILNIISIHLLTKVHIVMFKSSPPEVFPGKGVLKIRSKFTREHPCRSAISIKLLCNLIEITLRHGCSLTNLLHIFRTTFPKNTSGLLLLYNLCLRDNYFKA